MRRRKATLQTQLQATENNRASQAELKPTPPNVTLRTQMTLYRGDREIQIRFLGRAHTAGDVVVYLPREKVVITGDMLTTALSNMSDAFVNEWPATLDEVKKLDFDTVLPGHGDAFTDKAKIDYFQAYLRDVWTEVSRLKQQGVSAEEAAKRADLTKHKEHFPAAIQGPGVPVIGVTRIYELIDQAGPRRLGSQKRDRSSDRRQREHPEIGSGIRIGVFINDEPPVYRPTRCTWFVVDVSSRSSGPVPLATF